MKVKYLFSYYEDVVPPRCRKPRSTKFSDGEYEGEILCLDEYSGQDVEDLFPLAFVVYDKMYEPDPEMHEVIEYRGYAPTRRLYRRITSMSIQHVLGKDWSQNCSR